MKRLLASLSTAFLLAGLLVFGSAAPVGACTPNWQVLRWGNTVNNTFYDHGVQHIVYVQMRAVTDNCGTLYVGQHIWSYDGYKFYVNSTVNWYTLDPAETDGSYSASRDVFGHNFAADFWFNGLTVVAPGVLGDNYGSAGFLVLTFAFDTTANPPTGYTTV